VAAPGAGGSSGAGRQQRGGVVEGLTTRSSSGSRLEELAASAPSFYVGEAPMAADVVVGEHQEGPAEEEVEEVHGATAAAASTAGAGRADGGGDAGIDQGATPGSSSSSSSSSRPGCPAINVSSSSHGSSRPGCPNIVTSSTTSSNSSGPGSPQWAGSQEEGGELISQQTTDLEVVCSSPCSSKQGAGVTSFTSSSHLSDTEHPGQDLVTADAAGACPGSRYTSGGCELEPATPVSDATGCGPHTSSSDDRCLSDEDLDVCGVCLDAPVNIALQSCQHPLCGGCAERVVSMQTTRPAACPFCRLHISGFRALQLTL
jgi:hypothetical protein